MLGLFCLTKLMLGMGRSSQTRVRLLLQASSYLKSEHKGITRLTYTSIVQAGKTKGTIVHGSRWFWGLNRLRCQIRRSSDCRWAGQGPSCWTGKRETKSQNYNFGHSLIQAWLLYLTTLLFDCKLVGGIMRRVEAQNHPLISKGWNLVALHPSTSASQSLKEKKYV